MGISESRVRQIIKEELTTLRRRGALSEISLGDIAGGVSRTFRSGGLPGSSSYNEEKLEDYKEDVLTSDLWKYGIKPLLLKNGSEFYYEIQNDIRGLMRGGTDRPIRVSKRFKGSQMPTSEFRIPREVDGEETDLQIYCLALLDVISEHGAEVAGISNRRRDAGHERDLERDMGHQRSRYR